MVDVVIVLMPAPEKERAAVVKYVDIGSTIIENLLSGNKSGGFMFKKQLNCQIFEIIKIKLGKYE
jgi:hypothetical protein